MKKNKELKISNKISIAFIAIILLVALVFYFLLPSLLNYPPDTINTQFDKDVSKLYYIYQYLIIMGSIILLFIIYFKISLRKIDKWVTNKNTKDIKEIRKICFTYPYNLFAIIEILPISIVIITLLFTGSHPLILIFKIGILVFSFATLLSSLLLIITKKIFYPILKETSANIIHEKNDKKSLTIRLIVQIFPSVLVSVLVIALIGYSRLTKEKGDLLNTYYKSELQNLQISKEQDLLQQVNEQMGSKLLSQNDYIFIETPQGEILTTTEKRPTDFFIKYMHELSTSNNDRVYEAYTIDEQGAIRTLIYNNQQYIVGVHYEIVTSSLLTYFLLAAGILFIFHIVVLRYVVHSINADLENLTDGMKDILDDPDNIETKKLPLTSNDIMGEMVQSFNEIQEMTRANIQKIHDNQDTLIEKERLATLGQMIGGIAHNLKTPIMSISGATEGISTLIKEYELSIDNPQVNSEDHHEIAKDMKEWIDKIKHHLEYMSDIITAVKGQAVNFSEGQQNTFTISELIKHVNILMKHELKNAIVYLNTDIICDENTSIKGNMNSLVQVINNMISNAIQAYEGKTEQNIDFTIKREGDNVVISVKDYGPGLPENVQEKLFKQMITTKGKNGTGLGLYMSYSNIKAHFNGDITVYTNKGKGTTFNIILPIYKV